MKFNWRANWEILLVLVIIVVGIVITTIAAIKNKDKQLFALPEETDFSQLLASSNGANSATGNSNPNDSNAQQAENTGAGSSHDGSESAGNGRRSPQQNPTKAPQRVSSPTNLRAATFNRNRYQRPHDDSAEYSRHQQLEAAGGLPKLQQVAAAATDAYDASSTEVTPSQMRSTANFHDHFQQHNRPSTGSRRQVANRTQHPLENQPTDSGDSEMPIGDFGDDIHTTRSSLASPSNLDSYAATAAIPSPQTDPVAITQSLALHGPYSVTPSLQLQQKQHHQMTEPPGSDSDEPMMTSYSRQSRGNNHTDALLRDYNPFTNKTDENSNPELVGSAMLANLIASMPQSSQALGEPTGPTNEPFPAPNTRGFSSGSPLMSSLLNDLLKLARPQQLINSLQSGNNPHQQQHQNPMETRQNSILQQLRSLPGPLLSLIQSLGQSGSNLNQANNPNDLSNLMSHDASESNQHYHRISMSPTDINSILARSMRSSGVLPAFPAPRGAQQNWIPPTSGGNPAYHSAQNSNADFVASNAAGFLRSNSNSLTSQQQAGPTEHQHYPTQPEVTNSAPQTQQTSLYPPSEQQQQQGPELQQRAQQQNYQSPESRNWPAPSPSDLTTRYKQSGYGGPHQKPPNNNNNPQQLQPAITFNNQPPVYNSRPTLSEIAVPLGYQQQQAAAAPLQRPSFENHYNPMAGGQSESSPKAVVIVANSMIAKQQQQQQVKLAPKSGPGSRRKRSIESQANENMGRVDEEMSGKYIVGEEPEDDDSDARPISVVRPDGRPLVGGGRVGGQPATLGGGRNQGVKFDDSQDRQVAQSQQSTRHHHHQHQQMDKEYERSHQVDGKFFHQSRKGVDNRIAAKERGHKSKHRKPVYQERKRKANYKKGANLEAAGSGLMSRLLGTASTNDELEEDIDDDDEYGSVNEKKKDELDDTDFGLNNADDRLKVSPELSVKGEPNGDEQVDKRPDVGKSLQQQFEGNNNNEQPAAAQHSQRRHQHRSDIDFYGHPGEETRQLKYGILGSGNYEVVNGGIYPEADESTAAVNSVANYVRKPGSLLASIPKLLAEHSQINNNNPGPASGDGFMPGGRLVGGFLRGASADQELIGLLPAAGVVGGGGDEAPMTSPLLELIDANGNQMIDPNLLAHHLRSSGSSSRTTHASKNDDTEEEKNVLEVEKHDDISKQTSNRKINQGKKLKVKDRKQKQQEEGEHNGPESHTKGSADGSSKSNQFNSYHILPSKKVTIFSDQDLDSAPDELHFRRIQKN